MFEVVSALESRKRRKRLRFAGLSAGIHLLVLGSIVAASLWQVGDITPPDLPIPAVIVDTIPGPPPPRGKPDGGGRKTETHRTTPPHQDVVQPPAIPPDTPKNTDSQSQDSTSSSTDRDSNNQGSDEPPGFPWGTEDSTGHTDGGGGDSTPIPAYSDGVIPPVPISQPKPAYPDGPRILHQTGIVILQAIIGTDGSVENLSVLKSASPLLDESALKAVGRWRYTPATLNGRTVRVVLTVTVNFTLR